MPGGRRIFPARRPTDARRCNREVAHRQAQSDVSHEVPASSAFTGRVALSGAASHRSIPLRRLDAVAGKSHFLCSWATALVVALVVFRLAGIQTMSRVPTPIAGHASPHSCRCGRRRSATRHRHARPDRAWTGKCLSGGPMTLMGFFPFAVLLLLPGGLRRVSACRAHVPFA